MDSPHRTTWQAGNGTCASAAAFSGDPSEVSLAALGHGGTSCLSNSSMAFPIRPVVIELGQQAIGWEVAAALRVIDTLTAGFSAVTSKLWLATVPIALDIFLWVGPKLSVGPVIDQMVGSFRRAVATAPPMGPPNDDLSQVFEMAGEELQNTIGRTNLLSLLGWGRLGMPGIAGIRPIDPAVDRIVEISSYGQMFLAQIVILAVGLVIACVFLGMLGQAARGESLDLGKLSKNVPLYWLRMMAILVPLGIALVFMVLSGFMLGPLAFLVWAIMLWMLIYVSFFPQGITLADEGPRVALWRSLTLVRSSFWPCVGLIVLTNVIGAGMSLVWRLLMASPAGTVVAIVGNAYVGTGLTMALFIFYRNRTEQVPEPSKQEGERPL